MLRRFAAVLSVLAVFAGVALAEELKGTVLRVDPEEATITFDAGGKELTKRFTDKTRWGRIKGPGKTKPIPIEPEKLPGLFDDLNKAGKGKGTPAVIITKGEGKREIAVDIFLIAPGKKD